jgi:hypothetical protein
MLDIVAVVESIGKAVVGPTAIAKAVARGNFAAIVGAAAVQEATVVRPAAVGETGGGVGAVVIFIVVV